MGKQPSEKGRKYNIQRVQERHRAVLSLLASGLGNKEAAMRTGMTPQMVSNVKNSPIGRQRLSELQSASERNVIEARARLQEVFPEALSLLEETMRDEERVPLTIRLRVAQDILDRGGVGKAVEVKGQFAHALLSLEDIKEIKARALEAIPVEVEVEEETMPA